MAREESNRLRRKQQIKRQSAGIKLVKIQHFRLSLFTVKACEVCAGGGHKRWLLEFLFWLSAQQWSSQRAFKAARQHSSPSCRNYSSPGLWAASCYGYRASACASSCMQARACMKRDSNTWMCFTGQNQGYFSILLISVFDKPKIKRWESDIFVRAFNLSVSGSFGKWELVHTPS